MARSRVLLLLMSYGARAASASTENVHEIQGFNLCSPQDTMSLPWRCVRQINTVLNQVVCSGQRFWDRARAVLACSFKLLSA